MTESLPLTLGTGGHIDHGKTALIRALTGVDTDRLPQERARGISIELGFASLRLPSGRRLSVIDVPGHERFVRTMVAGATGIDLYLMAVAAEDGVMPQTREHAAVLEALAVRQGVVAVTKTDLADPQPAMLQAAELLPEAEVVTVSARTGAGLEALTAALERTALKVPSRAQVPGRTRLHIDRVFTIRGAGTVVTGTLWAGEIARGEQIELRPQRLRTRVRALHVHDQPVERVAAGQRVAVNLTGVSTAELARGDVIVAAGSPLQPSYRLDVVLESRDSERQLEPGDRVQIHHGTRESSARLAWLGGRFWQVRLEQPLIAADGDRLVIRRIAPPDTIGGGRVLDSRPRRHGPSRDLLARLQALASGPTEVQSAGGERAVRHARNVALRTASPGAAAQSSPLTQSALALEAQLRSAGLEPPSESKLNAEDLAALRATGRAIRVSKTLHYHPEVLTQVRQRVIALANDEGAITLAQVRDELGTSRKYAQALLEHLDSEKVTIRRGDAHMLRRGVGDT